VKKTRKYPGFAPLKFWLPIHVKGEQSWCARFGVQHRSIALIIY